MSVRFPAGQAVEFDYERRPALLAAALEFLLVAVPLLRLEVTTGLYLAGVPVGFLAGGLVGRYGNALNTGLLGSAAGGVLGSATIVAYGSYASWRLGFGLDSAFAAQYGFRGLAFLLILVPLHVAQAGLGAVVANRLRCSIGRRTG